jgi:hypothetical protein
MQDEACPLPVCSIHHAYRFRDDVWCVAFTSSIQYHDSVVKLPNGLRRQKTREWLPTRLATSSWQATTHIA